MKIGDKIATGIAIFNNGKYANLDNTSDIVVTCYTDSCEPIIYHKKELTRINESAYLVNIDTSKMKEGVLICEFYCVSGGRIGIVYTNKLGFLKI